MTEWILVRILVHPDPTCSSMFWFKTDNFAPVQEIFISYQSIAIFTELHECTPTWIIIVWLLIFCFSVFLHCTTFNKHSGMLPLAHCQFVKWALTWIRAWHISTIPIDDASCDHVLTPYARNCHLLPQILFCFLAFLKDMFTSWWWPRKLIVIFI